MDVIRIINLHRSARFIGEVHVLGRYTGPVKDEGNHGENWGSFWREGTLGTLGTFSLDAFRWEYL